MLQLANRCNARSMMSCCESIDADVRYVRCRSRYVAMSIVSDRFVYSAWMASKSSSICCVRPQALRCMKPA